MSFTLRKKITVGFLITACLASLTIWWFTQSHSHFNIEPFVYERDMADVLNIFDENWYWLIPEPKEHYSPHYLPYVFKYRAPGANPMRHNSLQINVIRDQGHVIGFNAFFKKSKTVGQILFIAVQEKARKKGMGEALFRHAMDTLLEKEGCTQLILLTRMDNDRAQRLYKRFGFTEAFSDAPGFIYFSYKVQ